MCPGGGLYSLLGKIRVTRVKRVADKCTLCGDCVVVCPMGLVPMQDVMGVECDNCGLCVSSCNDDALGYSISLKDEPFVSSVGTNKTDKEGVVQSA